jgi:hypothetical protein
MVTATAAIRAILRIGASYGYNHRMQMAPQKIQPDAAILPPSHADSRAILQ